MRLSFVIILLSLFAGNAFSQSSKTSQEAVEDNTKLILFVIKVPLTDSNAAQVSKIKEMKADGVNVKVSGDFVEIHYLGAQLTSAVDPSFIEEIKVYKDEKAKEAYPSSNTDSVIEMVVKDAKTLVDVFDAIKAM